LTEANTTEALEKPEPLEFLSIEELSAFFNKRIGTRGVHEKACFKGQEESSLRVQLEVAADRSKKNSSRDGVRPVVAGVQKPFPALYHAPGISCAFGETSQKAIQQTEDTAPCRTRMVVAQQKH